MKLSSSAGRGEFEMTRVYFVLCNLKFFGPLVEAFRLQEATSGASSYKSASALTDELGGQSLLGL